MPLRFAEPNQPPQSAPRLGADTEAVLLDVLGVSSAEFGRLHDQGAGALRLDGRRGSRHEFVANDDVRLPAAGEHD
jgi:hypothetical protein